MHSNQKFRRKEIDAVAKTRSNIIWLSWPLSSFCRRTFSVVGHPGHLVLVLPWFLLISSHPGSKIFPGRRSL
jgi:hypothetical protein